jgi:ABC-type polysaccharide/polyol phosphate transport system ATPase subunit
LSTRPAILVEDVSVRFRPYVDRKPTLRRSLGRLRHREQQEVIALDGVSFRVSKGEAYGIIGRNGAGKSTLLRCIAGTLRPNSGKVVVNGKLSTLLQLGVGFNPELSGHRNIYLGALAAGLRKKEIDQIFDDIVEYAELGSAIDRPVKTYSSGMFAKLAFSVSMHLDPDVLLLDEVLAVGDVAFRAKSMETMQELLDKSGTIVFVSHSMNSVEEFCDRVLWLQDGRVMAEGDAAEVVGLYKKAATGSTKNA